MIIGVLSVLMAVSLAAFAVTFIHNKRIENNSAMVSVPDNLITAEDVGVIPEEQTTPTEQEPPAAELQTSAAGIPKDNKDEDTTVSGAQWRVTAASLRLYDKQSEDNKPFEVGNMFPGDSATHYFRVQVSYSGSVTVRYHADILTGYEKLAEVLKVRIKMLNDNTILYDGLMRDMPESVTNASYQPNENGNYEIPLTRGIHTVTLNKAGTASQGYCLVSITSATGNNTAPAVAEPEVTEPEQPVEGTESTQPPEESVSDEEQPEASAESIEPEPQEQANADESAPLAFSDNTEAEQPTENGEGESENNSVNKTEPNPVNEVMEEEADPADPAENSETPLTDTMTAGQAYLSPALTKAESSYTFSITVSQDSVLTVAPYWGECHDDTLPKITDILKANDATQEGGENDLPPVEEQETDPILLEPAPEPERETEAEQPSVPEQDQKQDKENTEETNSEPEPEPELGQAAQGEQTEQASNEPEQGQ